MQENSCRFLSEADSRRVTWSYRETIDLLDICLARNVGKVVSMKHKNIFKREVFEEVGREMNRRGHGKSLEQVIVKFKNLLQKYKKGLTNRSSRPVNKKRAELWNRMHEISKYCVQKEALMALKSGSQTTGNMTTKQERAVFESFMNAQTDPLLFAGAEDIKIEFNASNSEDPFSSSSPAKLKKEMKTDNDVKKRTPQRTSAPKSDRSTANYLRCVRYLVEKFKTAQEDLQNKFYTQQLRLQQQQQEWEEKILDEEREFFAKILKSTDNVKRKIPTAGDIPSEDDAGI